MSVPMPHDWHRSTTRGACPLCGAIVRKNTEHRALGPGESFHSVLGKVKHLKRIQLETGGKYEVVPVIPKVVKLEGRKRVAS